jgi:hypothetical protein
VDAERMIEEIVASLALDWSGETNDFTEWYAEWQQLGGYTNVEGLRARAEGLWKRMIEPFFARFGTIVTPASP